MINCYVKGQRAEREVEKLLLNVGYLQVYKAPYIRFVKNHDIWNAWDLACININKQRQFIQVKTSLTGYSSAKKPLVEWVKKYGVNTEIYSLFFFGKGKVLRLFDCYTGVESKESD